VPARKTSPRGDRVSGPAGYSGTPLPAKLGFKEGTRAAFVGAPPRFRDLLDPLPTGVHFPRSKTEPLDLVLLFAPKAAALDPSFRDWAARLAPAGMLWVAWPKKTSGIATDLTENRVRDLGLEAGLVDVKVCAIDPVWSGLKFVRRLRDR
jgi:hypothetical protein